MKSVFIVTYERWDLNYESSEFLVQFYYSYTVTMLFHF